MGFIKLILAISMVVPFQLLAVELDSLFEPFREGKSNYVKASEVKSARKYFGLFHEPLLIKARSELLLLEDEPEKGDYSRLLNELAAFSDQEWDKKKKITDKRKFFDHLNNLLRDALLIDDTFHRLLSDYVAKAYPTPKEIEAGKSSKGPALTLKDYLTKKAGLIKAFNKMTKSEDSVDSEKDNPFPIKEFSAKALGYSGLSVRERLFYLYSVSQIREMAEIIELSLNVADAEKVTTTITFRNSEDEALTLEHSPTDQYRLAIRVMRMEKKKAENDRLRIGVPIQQIDLVASAYEMGVLSYEELSLIVHNKDFYLPEVPMMVKVGKYIGNLALLGVRVHPVTAPYAIIPMLLYNSYVQTKKAGQTIDEDSFFFTLPERKK